MPQRLEGDILDVSECFHYRLVRLKNRATTLAAQLPVEYRDDADNLAHEIEDIKLHIGNQITAAVLATQARRSAIQQEITDNGHNASDS